MHKGQVLSEAHKAKLLKANLGRVRTEEEKAKNRVAHLGKVASTETRTKLSLVHKGRVRSKESRLRYRLARLGKTMSEETKVKLRWAKIGHCASAETREKMRLAHKGRVFPAAFGEKIKRRWRDPIYRDKTIRAQRLALAIHPNKPEAKIMDMLERICPSEFKFVGDGQVIIAGKNPDFININGRKQIIECFGDYWHGEKARCFEETEEGRIKLFKEYGFDTLIIWEGELKVPEKVTDKIINFIKGGK